MIVEHWLVRFPQGKPQYNYNMMNCAMLDQLSVQARIELGLVLHDESRAGSSNYSCAGVTEDLMRMVEDLRSEGVSYTSIAEMLKRRRHTKALRLGHLHYAACAARQRQKAALATGAFAAFSQARPPPGP